MLTRIKTLEDYQRVYKDSVDNPEKFWAEHAKRIDWIEPWKSVKETSFEGEILGILFRQLPHGNGLINRSPSHWSRIEVGAPEPSHFGSRMPKARCEPSRSDDVDLKPTHCL